MTREAIVEINKLLNIQTHLEKSINSVFVNIKKYNESGEIVDTLNTIQCNSEDEKKYVQNAINDIYAMIKDKKQALSKRTFIENTDFKVFKNEMITIQSNIQNLKTYIKSKLTNVQQEINNLDEDVNFYSERMNDWATKVTINEYPSISHYKQSTAFIKHRVKDVQDFMDFVHKNNGHENGWRKEDHQLFIKLYNKYKDVDILAKNLNEILPDISTDEIKKHHEWYHKYLQMKKRKKEAIKKWQQSKISKKKINGNNDEDNVHIPKILPGGASPETIQEKLQKWKAEKEEQMRIARQLEEEQLLKKKEKDELRKRRNIEMRRIVNDWKQTRLEMEQQEVSRKKVVEKNVRRQRATEANKLIKQFQSQDDMFIMKMRDYKNRKNIEIPTRSKSSNVVACRDPNRLLQPTKQWINRVHDDTVYNSTSSLVLPLKKLPRLGIPEWRKSIGNEKSTIS